MKRGSAILAGVVLVAAQFVSAEPARAPDIESLKPTAAERDARLGWWREARFGMFIHWGVYSGLSGTWNGKAYGGYAEHIQRMAKIPCAVYRKEVAGTFNPTGFNADEWIRLAKEAGMGYFVITAKHHDGFAMFNSQASDYNIVKATPFARDPMRELQAACKKHGLKFGFYYSHAFDWGEENGPGNDWDYQNPGGDRLLHGANWWEKFPEFLPKARKYVDEKSIPQLQELIRMYDPDIIWFDTPHKLPPEENLRILAAVRKAKPSLVVNGRLVRGAGDYDSTCDRPAEFPTHEGDWEGVPTTNESYGYNQNDRSHKPPAHFIQLLAKSAARGGNELMNIGPMGTGKMDPADIAILKGIGAWWQLNGESIRGTTHTPLAVQAWGESTLRPKSGPAGKDSTLYLHVFDWPRDGRLVIGGLKSEVKLAWLLRDKANTMYTHLKAVRVNPLDVRIEGLPKDAPDAADSIIAVECVGEPQTDPARLLATNVTENKLRGFDAKLEGKLQFGPGKTKDAWVTNWTKKDDAVVWPVRVNAQTTFQLAMVYDAPAATKENKKSEGDAGKELVRAGKGSGGTYVVKCGAQTAEKKVHGGNNVTDPLGTFTLPAGAHEIRVMAKEITGQELFRLRSLILKPVAE